MKYPIWSSVYAFSLPALSSKNISRLVSVVDDHFSSKDYDFVHSPLTMHLFLLVITMSKDDYGSVWSRVKE